MGAEMPSFEMDMLDEMIRAGAIRLEITNGIPTWEAFPNVRHQRIVDRIRATIKPSGEPASACECVHLPDIYVRFPDGSLKRPDIAIFCRDVPDQEEALAIVPEAVIEIVSRGYEYKDVVLNPPFYLGQGVRDVVIYDPSSQRVAHYTRAGVANHFAPVALALSCGCECTIPAS
jgi:Uma2 family endonuclease